MGLNQWTYEARASMKRGMMLLDAQRRGMRSLFYMSEETVIKDLHSSNSRFPSMYMPFFRLTENVGRLPRNDANERRLAELLQRERLAFAARRDLQHVLHDIDSGRGKADS